VKEKAMVEAIVFASKGISLKRLAKLVGVDEDAVRSILEELMKEYSSEDHGVELREIDGVYRFYTKRGLADVVGKSLRRNFTKLTSNQLEVVVIIAMNGPLTRAEIDEMRGKDSSNVVRKLHGMGVLRRRRKGKKILYDLSRPFKESSIYERILEMLRGGEGG